MLPYVYLITPGKLSLMIHEDQLAFFQCVTYQLRKLLFGRAGVGCGDTSTDLVVVQIHRLAVCRITRHSFVRGGKRLRPFVAEFLGEQRIPVGMAKGIAVPVIELPLCGALLWNIVRHRLVRDMPLALAKRKVLGFFKF
ncbi:hypothetical protein XnspCFBP7698_16385 [Xanthomonas sp. CFBP 7698]|nr:hypothetical protein XnspCFBP7698_16385 [Xanthomonas sp. CFBP 7698]